MTAPRHLARNSGRPPLAVDRPGQATAILETAQAKTPAHAAISSRQLNQAQEALRDPRKNAAALQVQVLDSLSGYAREQLEQVTAASSIFFDARWFALLEALDLNRLVGGAVRLRYVVVSRAGDKAPVAICPFLICRDPNVYFFYSLDKYFFLHWQVEAARMAPQKGALFRRLAWFTRVYRALARLGGAQLGGWVLAVSPLSHRGDIALDPRLDEASRAGVIRTVLQALQETAVEESLPLCFFGVEHERHELRRELAGMDFRELFLVYDHVLNLEGMNTLDDYLAQFRSDGRRLLRRETRAAAQAGLRFEAVSACSDVAAELTALYHATYGKYGEEHFQHPPEFWAGLEEFLGAHAEALLAYEGRELVGFSMLLGKRDLWFYRVGRRYDEHMENARLYFHLAFYEPIRRALAKGCRRVWLGAGASEAKHRRGGLGYALYSYLWFPRRWDRWLLMPYLDNFARISQAAQANASRPTNYFRADRKHRDTEARR